MISSRLDSTKRVGSTMREKPGDSSFKQLTQASNNLLNEHAISNSFLTSSSISPNK